jgi:hypothetical protein
MTSAGTAALPTILHDWANLRTYLQPTTTVKRYAAIPSHLVNVRIALKISEHSFPCYVISKPHVCLGLQVLSDSFLWTYDICFIWVYKIHCFSGRMTCFASVYKFHRFSERTAFVSFASTSLIVFFLKVWRLFHLRLQVSSFFWMYDMFHLSLQNSSFFWMYDICFIWVFKFHRFSGRTTFVSFASKSSSFFWT